MDPTVVADVPCTVGEGPLWHADEDRLYWIDNHEGRLYRYDPERDGHELVYDGPTFGAFTVQEDGSFLLFMADGRVENWDHRESTAETVVEDLPRYRGSRYNDVIADPEGRVYCGMKRLGERPGALYRLDTDGTIARVVDDLGLPNGMGFTPDSERLYLTDSGSHLISTYDYDRETEALSDRETFVRTPIGRGIPDGMTVDAEGYVWSARWNDGRLIRYAPDGTEDRRVEFPVWKVSSVTAGGPDYADAYVTTAGGDDRRREGTRAGSLFRLPLDVTGVPEFRSRVRP
jgi:D-xylonolactonase